MTLEGIGIALGVVGFFIALASAAASWNSAGSARTSAHAAERSADISAKQLEIVERKIGMVTDPDKMTEILPAWYVKRMGSDNWGFGLLLRSGSIVAIERIEALSDNGEWIEVHMLEKDERPDTIQNHPVLYRVKEERPTASLRVDQIQAAFEIISS